MRSVTLIGRNAVGRAMGGTVGLAMAWAVVAQLPAERLTGVMSSTSGPVVPR